MDDRSYGRHSDWRRCYAFLFWLHLQAFQGQLAVMRGQLKELESSGKQTDELIKANNKLVESAQLGNRAWIAPRMFSIVGAIKEGQKIEVKVLYDNAGKTPATDVEFRAIGRTLTFEGRRVPRELYTNVKLGPNLACEADVTNYAGVVYPASIHAANVSSFFTSDLSLAKAVMAVSTVYAVQGCFRYRTMDVWHYSRFCTVLTPLDDKPVDQWVFGDCADGNEAD
jgi:hypothetical protein